MPWLTQLSKAGRSKIAVARPRSRRGIHSRIALTLLGYAGASPTGPAAEVAAHNPLGKIPALVLEDGTMKRLPIGGGGRLPGIDAVGYHRLEAGGHRFTLAVAPRRCPAPPGRGWGTAVQIPALRGSRAPFFFVRMAWGIRRGLTMPPRGDGFTMATAIRPAP